MVSKSITPTPLVAVTFTVELISLHVIAEATNSKSVGGFKASMIMS